MITIGLVVRQSETLSSGAKAKARTENYNGQPPIQKESGHENEAEIRISSVSESIEKSSKGCDLVF